LSTDLTDSGLKRFLELGFAGVPGGSVVPGQIQIGDIQLQTTAGQTLVLRRVARPNPEQKRILDALGLNLPERLSPDRLLQ
jgi:hypothetical protein